MNWVWFAIGAALSWGLYGPMLHKGQVALGNPMRALLCVGFAYLLVAILDPGWDAGLAGAVEQLQRVGHDCGDDCRRFGRLRCDLRDLGIQGGGSSDLRDADRLRIAPLVNVLYTMCIHPPKVAPNPMLYVGFLLTAVGAGMVLYFKPQG